jgi:hypothetical protein
LWYKRDVSDALLLQRLREGALTAVGLIIIGKPGLMLQSLTLNLLEHQHSAEAAAAAAGTVATSAHSGGSADAGSPEPDQQQLQRQLSARGSGALQGLGSGVSVVRVYTAVLSEPHVSMAVKGKVLISLVDLLR